MGCEMIQSAPVCINAYLKNILRAKNESSKTFRLRLYGLLATRCTVQTIYELSTMAGDSVETTVEARWNGGASGNAMRIPRHRPPPHERQSRGVFLYGLMPGRTGRVMRTRVMATVAAMLGAVAMIGAGGVMAAPALAEDTAATAGGGSIEIESPQKVNGDNMIAPLRQWSRIQRLRTRLL